MQTPSTQLGPGAQKPQGATKPAANRRAGTPRRAEGCNKDRKDRKNVKWDSACGEVGRAEGRMCSCANSPLSPQDIGLFPDRTLADAMACAGAEAGVAFLRVLRFLFEVHTPHGVSGRRVPAFFAVFGEFCKGMLFLRSARRPPRRVCGVWGACSQTIPPLPLSAACGRRCLPDVCGVCCRRWPPARAHLLRRTPPALFCAGRVVLALLGSGRFSRHGATSLM